MSQVSTVLLTTGVPGAGKSYVRCSRFLVDDFLVNSDGLHISNFPVNVDAVSEAVARKINFARSGILHKILAPFRRKSRPVTVDEVKARIVIIPDAVLQSWRSETSGPWEYFDKVCPLTKKKLFPSLKHSHIAIDEIQDYVSSKKSPAYLQKWDEFLGQVRHRGCSIEGLTQDYTQVDQCFIGRAALRLEIVPAETLRDPYFNILMLDWYNLKAGFTGEFHKTVFEVEKRKNGMGRFVNNHTRRFLITPDYFKFYNSYNASLQEKESGKVDENRAPEYEYQKRTKLGLLSWFLLKNFWQIVPRFILFALFIWLCFGGGLVYVIKGFIGVTGEMAKSNTQKSKVSAKLSPKVSQEIKQISVQEQIYYSPLSYDKQVELQQEHEKIKGEYEKMKADLEALKNNDLSEIRPVLFSSYFIILKSGERVKIGHVFNKKGASYDQLSIEKADIANRCFYLSDGRKLQL